MIHYIITISAKGILPKGESKSEGMKKLEEKFGLIQELNTPRPLYLTENGLDEKLYLTSMANLTQITSDEVDELKATFDAEKRILGVYRLQEMQEE